MKRYLLLPALLTLLLWMLVLVSVGVGRVLGRAPDGLYAQSDCVLPCWNGILPGQTPAQAADGILKTLGYTLHDSRKDPANSLPNQTTYDAPAGATVCQVGISRARGVVPIVSDLTLRVCDEAPLGHVMDMLGEPESFVPYVSMMTYARGAVSVILRSEWCDRPVSPRSPILFLSLALPVSAAPQSAALRSEQATGGDEEGLLSSQIPWRGFLPLWRYAQLYPDRVLC